MSDRDVLDKKLLSQFRWRTATDASEPTTTDSQAEDDPPEDSDDGTSDSEGEEASETRSMSAEDRAAMIKVCEDFARDVQRVWERPAGPQDIEIARGAIRLGLSLAWFSLNHQREAVRLMRIILRSWKAVRDACDSNLPFALMWMRLEHPEVVEVIVSGVSIHWNRLLYALEQSVVTEENGARYPQIGERLAPIIDDTSLPWRVRSRAAGWIGVASSRAVVPALRRALREPSVPLRTRALYALVHTLPPQELVEDVQFVLEDSIGFPIDARDGRSLEVVWGYSEQIVNAVKVVRPPNGYVPLEAILRGECKYSRRHRAVLDTDGALATLAAGYPERAVVWIDAWLASLNSLEIHKAVIASEHLPAPLARSRLYQGIHMVSGPALELAKRAWSKIFGSECPIDPNGGVELVGGQPPSDKFASRLLVLHSSNGEAVNAMGRVLLNEAPDSEALALLVWGWRTDAFGYAPDVLPSSRSDWLAMLVEKFGEAGFDECAKVVESSARVGGSNDILAALARSAIDSGNPAWIARARGCLDLAKRAPFESRSSGVVNAIEALGAREEDLDLLWEIACPTTSMRQRSSVATSFEARDALRGDSVRKLVADRVTREMEQYKDNWPRLKDVLAVGVSCELPSALECATEWSRTPWIDDATRTMARECMMVLAHDERLDEEWAFASAADNDSPVRRNAIHSLLQFKRDERALQLYALAYQSEDLETCVLGADGLFRLDRTDLVGVLDLARINACLSQVHYESAVEFLFLHLWKTKSLVPFEAHFRRLLTGTKTVAMAMAEAVMLCDRTVVKTLFDSFAPGELDAEVYENLSLSLRLPQPHETYWQHITDDEDDDSEFESDEVQDVDTRDEDNDDESEDGE